MANSTLPPPPATAGSSAVIDSLMYRGDQARLNNNKGDAISAYKAVVETQVAPPVAGVTIQRGGLGPSLAATVDNNNKEAVASSLYELQLRHKETAIYCLGELYAETKNTNELQALIRNSECFFHTLPRARTAKIVRRLMEAVARVPDSGELLLDMYTQCIDWCRKEKRTFLRHRVEARLALLYHQIGRLQEGLELITEVLKEVKKLDDRLLLVELHLIESKIYWTTRNIAKSKAALTAARTNANAIHCPPMLQGDIDLQGGILHAQEKDFKTAFSYFFEAFEAFGSVSPIAPIHHLPAVVTPGVAVATASGDSIPSPVAPPTTTEVVGLSSVPTATDVPRALQALKYLMLAKVMCGQVDDLTPILSGKQGLKYASQLDALRAVAKCHKERSLSMFETTLAKYESELYGDAVLKHHISDLYETLLEQNILRILEPFSHVEIAHVAKLMELPQPNVQRKLGEMVLDGKLQGTLDQGTGVLILFDEPTLPDTYDDALATLTHMGEVVETLHEKAQQAV
eukprot:GHVS01034107.1.p1 GENE.GHVS01034107.1~~GHVS01034107.1.p1  ORF type:complete len:516 (+),score=74.90 GHVS01034107.1:145-1692(+)